jgi:hypothetical protein
MSRALVLKTAGAHPTQAGAGRNMRAIINISRRNENPSDINPFTEALHPY